LLPKKYKWEGQGVKTEKKKGRANKGEIGDWRKATRKGRRRRMLGKKSSYRWFIMVENKDNIQ
jgi:hypothetical protein